MLKPLHRARSYVSRIFVPVFALTAVSLSLTACMVEAGADPLDPTAESASSSEHALSASVEEQDIPPRLPSSPVVGAELDARPVVANAEGCIQYLGVITDYEEVNPSYKICCLVTRYYDRFYNQCTKTYSDYFLHAEQTCHYCADF